MSGFATMDKMVTDKAERARRRALEDEDRTIAAEDRARRRASEDENIGFQREQRDQQRKAWQDDANVKGAYGQAATDATMKRNADIEKSIQPIEAQGPTTDGRGLPAWQVGDKTFTDQTQAKAAAQDGVKPFLDYYVKEGTPKVTEAYIRAGQPEKAKAYQEWVKNEQVQKGMESWARAMQSAQMGDAEGFAKHTMEAYNNSGYFDDGLKGKANLRKDDKGKTVGVDLEFTDASGKVAKQSFDGMESLYRFGTMFLSPEQVFKFGMSQLEATDKARADIAKEQRGLQADLTKEKYKSDLKRQEEGAGVNPYASGKFNEGQGKAAAFSDRMAEAEAVISANEGINSGITGGIGGAVSSTLPAGVGNIVASTDRQKVNQAQRNFINAVLRKESGAVINEREFANARLQYFPQPGDSAEVIAQKRQNRATATGGMMREAGPSYRPPQGWSGPGSTPASGGDGIWKQPAPQQGAPGSASNPQVRGQAPQPAAQGRAGLPTAAIEALRQNPKLSAQFDQWYGPGAAARILGVQ
ncbi:hypothetical protein [Xanthobacter autotrophicus]|uniref:hypothetical protein n=1 Tax=Xanthobacter autotrophicus TaxID=280 RepID=UPI0024A63E2D|nr:hypothetical protein [Xanthobacter autotrophicus]MDI4655556.1 hypothetical protein [Xanthobacter autotrophicus]